MGGSPELAYLTSLRDPSPSSTFQCSSLMGQDPSGCAECSLGCWVCRHLVTGAHHPIWRSGIAKERAGHCAVPEVACAGKGHLQSPKPSCPTWHITGVCAAGWSLVRVVQACSDLHVPPMPGTPWPSKQPLLSHGDGSACGQGHPLVSSWVPAIPPGSSNTCPRAATLQSHRGWGDPCGWWARCMGKYGSGRRE